MVKSDQIQIILQAARLEDMTTPVRDYKQLPLMVLPQAQQ
jgi:hypothetical protein